MSRKEVLLTVSGSIAPDILDQISRGQRPIADYIALSDRFPADLLDYPRVLEKGGRFSRLLKRVGGANLALAWACFSLRKQYRLIFFDGEQVGIPYAVLMRLLGRGSRPRHLMISHILSVPKKGLLLDIFHLQRYIDLFIVYSTWQKQFIERRWNIPSERVAFSPFMVDSSFFSPEQPVVPIDFSAANPNNYPMISTAGLERRDYQTLIEAVRGQPVFVVVAAASPWAKQRNAIAGVALPENVHVQKFSQFDLRRVYAASRFIVMPLQNVNFQAGVTAILEAMAMARAVVCTRTPGQTDIIVDYLTGVYVPPADPDALRAAILDLIENPQKAETMGLHGRERIEAEMSLDCYVERLNAYVQRHLS